MLLFMKVRQKIGLGSTFLKDKWWNRNMFELSHYVQDIYIFTAHACYCSVLTVKQAHNQLWRHGASQLLLVYPILLFWSRKGPTTGAPAQRNKLSSCRVSTVLWMRLFFKEGNHGNSTRRAILTQTHTQLHTTSPVCLLVFVTALLHMHLSD